MLAAAAREGTQAAVVGRTGGRRGGGARAAKQVARATVENVG